MTNWFPLELDTRAPDGTLVLVSAVAGQAARVHYTLDECCADSATLVLADSRQIPMLVPGGSDGEASCDLPADAPDSGEVRLLAVDDVGNARTLTLAIAIVSAVSAPSPGRQLPYAPAPRISRRLVRTHARAGMRSRGHLLATVGAQAAAHARATTRIRRRAVPIPAEAPIGRLLHDRAAVALGGRDRLIAQIRGGARAGVRGTDSVDVTREDPATLMLLDVL